MTGLAAKKKTMAASRKPAGVTSDFDLCFCLDFLFEWCPKQVPFFPLCLCSNVKICKIWTHDPIDFEKPESFWVCFPGIPPCAKITTLFSGDPFGWDSMIRKTSWWRMQRPIFFVGFCLVYKSLKLTCRPLITGLPKRNFIFQPFCC